MKIIIRSLAGLLTIALIIAVGALIFVSTFDANQYRQEIEMAIKKFSGHTVQLRGPLAIGLFPQLHLNAENFQLVDASGLTEHLLTTESISASIQILPLLAKELQLGTIQVRQPKLHLVNDKQGHNNWDAAITAPPKKAAGVEKPSDSMPFSFNIDAIELLDAEIIWDDRQNQQYFQLTELDLATETLTNNAPFNVHLSGSAYTEPEANNKFTFAIATRLSLDKSFKHIELQQLAINARHVQGQQLSPAVEIHGHADVNLDEETAQLVLEKATMDELEVYGNIELSNFNQAPQLQGELHSQPFDLRALAETLSMQIPRFSNRKTLSAIQIHSRWQANDQWIELKEITIGADDSRIDVRGRVALSAAQDTTLDVHIDRIVLDPYLALTGDINGQTAMDEQAQHSEAKQANELVPTSGAIALQLTIDQLDWQQLQAEKINSKINIERQQLQASLLAAEVFGGTVQAQAKSSMHNQQHQWRFDVHGKNLAIEQITAAVGEDNNFLRGRTAISVRGTATGMNATDIRQSFKGQAQLSLQQASLTDVKLAQTLEKVLSFLNRKPATKDGSQLRIESAQASFNIAHGIANNHDLVLHMPILVATGKGEIDFVRQQLDYMLKVKIKDREDLPIVPVLIYGPFDDLSYTPQLSKIIAERAAQEVKQRVKEGTKKIEEKLAPKVNEIKEKIEDKLKQLFKF